MGEMHAMTKQGDTTMEWNKNEPVEVGAARAAFETYMEKGYVAYEPGRLGRKGRRVIVFDPDLDKIILVPPIQGG